MAGRQSQLATQHGPPPQPEPFGGATRRAQRGKDRRRLGGHPDTDPHAGSAGTPSRVQSYTAAGQQDVTGAKPSALSPLRWRNQSRDPEMQALVHAAWRRDLREDFAVVRWYLHRQEAARAAAHHIEGYAHASRKDFGVMAGSLLGHDLAAADQ